MHQNYSDIKHSRFYRIFDRVILARPWLVIVVLGLALGLLATRAADNEVDASADALVLEGDKDLEFFREVAKRYSSEEFLIIAYQPQQGLFEDVTLERLAALVDDLKQLDGVSSVMSILDVPLLYSPKISISRIGSGIKTLRSEGVDRALVEQEFKESPIYRELLSSLNSDTTAIQVNISRDRHYEKLLEDREHLREKAQINPLDTNGKTELEKAEAAFKTYKAVATERQQQLVGEVRAVLDQHRAGAKSIFLGGVPMIASDMVAFVQSDLQVFGLGVLLFMIVLLAIIFRAVRWIVLPVTACLATIIFMLGLLGWLDWRMTVVSANFVSLLLIITLAIAVHLIVRYRELERLDATASSRQLAAASASLMLRPCIYTALTTIVAFGSLVVSGIRPIIDFGWMMTLGVLAALCITFIVVPIGMVLTGREGRSGRLQRESQSDEQGSNAVFTLKVAAITERFGIAILCAALILFVAAIIGIGQLKVENRFIDYFDEKTEIYQGMELVDARLGGTIPLEVILFSSAREQLLAAGSSSEFDGEFEEDFSDNEFGDEAFDDEFDEQDSSVAENNASLWFTRGGLEVVSRVHEHIDSLQETGKVLSLATVYQIASDLLGGQADDIQLSIAQRSLPASIKASLIEPYLNTTADEARITVRVKETSRTLNRSELLAGLHQFMQNDMGLQPDQYRLTGMLVLYNNMLQSLFSSQILTLGIVFVAITAMLIILFKSFSLAILAILPNMLAALLVLGGMGWVGLPLDLMTITIAAISVGIGVDNTIHYVHRFKTEFSENRNYTETMYRCHGSIGRAMYYTSVTIIFGFSILALSNFKPSIYFGLLTGLAMFSALVGALMLLPRLLMLFKPLGPESQSLGADG